MRVSAFLVQRSDSNTSKVIHDWQTCKVPGLVESVVGSAIINDESEFVGTITIDEPYNSLVHTVRCYVTQFNRTEDEAWLVCVSDHGAPDHDEIVALVNDNISVVWRKPSLISRFLEWID
jgi:hypothetical protein